MLRIFYNMCAEMCMPIFEGQERAQHSWRCRRFREWYRGTGRGQFRTTTPICLIVCSGLRTRCLGLLGVLTPFLKSRPMSFPASLIKTPSPTRPSLLLSAFGSVGDITRVFRVVCLGRYSGRCACRRPGGCRAGAFPGKLFFVCQALCKRLRPKRTAVLPQHPPLS